MSKMQEALDELKDKCRRAGAEWAEKIEPNQRQYDKAIPAAEAAVLALYEEQKAIADELAEALVDSRELDLCTECYYPTIGRPTCSQECCDAAARCNASLAAYNKAKEAL